MRTRGGHQVVMPLYRSHKIYPGKPEIPGLPATFGGEEDCDTLELVLWDQVLKLEAVLYYTAFRKLDVITRSVRVRNQGAEELYHRYVLAVYELQRRMTEEFPHILLENCSGGGGRYDPGMLYYSPQIWCGREIITGSPPIRRIMDTTAGRWFPRTEPNAW